MKRLRKNILFFIFLLFVNIFSVFPESLPEYLNGIAYYYMNMENYYEALFIRDEPFLYSNDVSKKKTFNYDIFEKHGIPFISIKNEKIAETQLILVNDDFIVLYRENEKTPYFIGQSQEGHGPWNMFEKIENINSTSFLKEKHIDYKPENLLNYNLDSPWVEGVTGYGIGEKITFECKRGKGLVIGIGYVSFEKPYLYEKNSRPKSVKLTLKDKNLSKVYELKDTPNPQALLFPYDERYEGKVELEILDVYKGVAWDDTCINFIQVINVVPPSMSDDED